MTLSHALLGLFLSLTPQEELGPAEFQKLYELLRPKPAEKWRTIPWKIDLLEARDLSVKSGKPLFLWSMNGHPLGCT